MNPNQILNQVFIESGLSKTEFSYALDSEPSRISTWLSNRENRENIKYSTLKRLLNNYGLQVNITFSKID